MIYPRFGSLYLIKIMAVLSLMSCSVKAQPQGEMTVPIRSDPLAIVSTQSISFARVSTANSRLSYAADERISAAASSKAKPESAAKGSLLLCGGSVIPDKILRQFHDIGRGSMGRLVIIPTASRLADQKGETDLWTKLWTAYPWQSIQLVHAATRSEAEEPAFADRIKYATAVWIAGGDQQRLFDRYDGTRVVSELKQLIARGGIVGGTSAGAAIMSNVMILGGVNQPRLGTGWGLLPELIIDQHFSQRSRFERLAQAVERNPNTLGVGIDESTGLLLNSTGSQVIGNGAVYIVDPTKTWSRLTSKEPR
jgi:cyanophycinase